MLSQQAQILLIDDDADVLDAYTMLLNQAGYQVQACNNPLKAQEMLGEEWPGIVISDVCMPGCSGIELMALLLAHDACLPVLLITGHGDVPMAVEAVKKGPGTSCKTGQPGPATRTGRYRADPETFLHCPSSLAARTTAEQSDWP